MPSTLEFLHPVPAMPAIGFPQRCQGSATKGDGPPRTDALAADPGMLARHLVGEIADKVETLCATLVQHPRCIPEYVPERLLAVVTERLNSAMLAREFPPVVTGRLLDVRG